MRKNTYTEKQQYNNLKTLPGQNCYGVYLNTQIAYYSPERIVYFNACWAATLTAILTKYSIAFPNSNK